VLDGEVRAGSYGCVELCQYQWPYLCNSKEDISYQSHGSMHTLRKRHVSTDQSEGVRMVLHTVAQKLSNVGARKPYSMMLAIDAVVRSMCIENCSGVSSKSCTNWQNLLRCQ
jgi:hypothetical protein